MRTAEPRLPDSDKVTHEVSIDGLGWMGHVHDPLSFFEISLSEYTRD